MTASSRFKSKQGSALKKAGGTGSKDKKSTEYTDETIGTIDDAIKDFDMDEDAHYDEMDRMEQRMERMEMDMDIMMNE